MHELDPDTIRIRQEHNLHGRQVDPATSMPGLPEPRLGDPSNTGAVPDTPTWR
jgi:hypothetical protein